MPLHARGAHYFGDSQVAKMLKCGQSHMELAGKEYDKIKTETGNGFSSFKCSCGTIINVTVRSGGEWEVQESIPRQGIERQ